MFGLGFTEILIIAVIAILFLGPDKLPTALVDMAKFFRNVKKTIGDVKDSIEQEMNVSEMKEEALAYKKELLKTTNEIEQTTKMADITPQLTSLNSSSMDEYLDDDDDTVKAEVPPKITPIPEEITKKENTQTSDSSSQAQEITFEKKSKQEEIKNA